MPVEVSQPSDCEVRVVRTFNAPRQLVWDAHTKPELMRKWCVGYPGWSMPICEMDVREGGQYRWRWKNDADGAEFGFHGAFSEVSAPSRIVHDQYFDPGGTDFAMPVGDPCIITLELSEANGVTTLTNTMRFISKEARDEAVATGMTEGMEHNYAHLDTLFKVAA